MSETEHLIGTLERAIARTARLLEADAALAAEQAEEILASIPNHPPAVFYLGIAKRRMGDVDAGLKQDDWGIDLFIKNATGEDAALFKTAQCVVETCQQNYGVRVRPMTIGLKFTKDWN